MSATESGTTATITTQAATDFAVGQRVLISGVGGSLTGGYNGTFTVTGVSGATFTYTTASGLAASSGGQATAVGSTLASATESGTTVTITTNGNTKWLTVGQRVDVTGVSVAGYNGRGFVVTAVSGNTFSYTSPNSGLANATGGTAF